MGRNFGSKMGYSEVYRDFLQFGKIPIRLPTLRSSSFPIHKSLTILQSGTTYSELMVVSLHNRIEISACETLVDQFD